MSKKVYLDFEFSGTNEAKLHVVCVSYVGTIDGAEVREDIWLLDPSERERFVKILHSWAAEGVTLVAFYAIAEAKAILSLGVDPRSFKWVDLWIEYRMLQNHNHELECGKQLIKGVVKFISPPKPKWEQEEGYSRGGVTETTLVACTYKLLGIKRDAGNKDDMRDLILSKKEFDDLEEMQILDYCAEDIVYLPQIHEILYKRLVGKYKSKDRKHVNAEILKRGEYAVATALMESKGYSIDYEATKSFAASVKDIVFQMQSEVNAEFPEVGAFLISNKGDKYTQKKKKIQAWVKDTVEDHWETTDKGDISLKLDAFEKHFSHRADQKIFGNRFVKYLRDKQALNGFSANTSKKTLWDFVGSDNRVRPYFGIFKAQSSRSQPSATSYVLLKSSWMRVLLQPPKGKCIVSIDYGQQEFLIAALLSNDSDMIKAYHSGDPYLYTGKLAGAIPWEATKETHGFMRDKFKSTVLAIQFGMTCVGLAKKLTVDTGVKHSEEEAQDLIELFEDSYPTYIEWKEELWDQYRDDGYLKLPCGWTMFGDNHNKRSALNMPVQGLGASIMREFVKKAQNAGLAVTMTLHDAGYIECNTAAVEGSTEILAWCMTEAFKKYFVGTPVEEHAVCRLDPAAWGPDFNGESVETSMGEMKLHNKYIDTRRFEDYKRYRKYFVPKEELDLLMSM